MRYLLLIFLLLSLPVVYANSYMVVIEGEEIVSADRSISVIRNNEYDSDYSLFLLDKNNVKLLEKQIPYTAVGEMKIGCLVDSLLVENQESEEVISYTYDCSDHFSIHSSAYFLDYHPRGEKIEFRKQGSVLFSYDIDYLSGYCGDGICQPHENWYTCPSDCQEVSISYTEDDVKYEGDASISSDREFVVDTVENCEGFLATRVVVNNPVNCLARTDEGWNVYAIDGELTIRDSSSINLNKITVNGGSLTLLNEDFIDDAVMDGSPFGQDLVVENGGKVTYTTRYSTSPFDFTDSNFIIKSDRNTGRSTFAIEGDHIPEALAPLSNTRRSSGSNDFLTLVMGEFDDVRDFIPLDFDTNSVSLTQGRYTFAVNKGTIFSVHPAFSEEVDKPGDLFYFTFNVRGIGR